MPAMSVARPRIPTTGNGTPQSPWNSLGGNFGGVTPVAVPGGVGTSPAGDARFPAPGNTITNTATPDPGIAGFIGDYKTRLDELRKSQNVEMDPVRLQRNIDRANATTAQAAAGQEANNTRYAAQLGGRDSLAALNRRTTERQASQMSSNAADMTEREQARLDSINEARRRELSDFTLGGLSGATAQANNALAQQGLGLNQLQMQQNYGLSQAQLEMQRQQQEWARQQQLLQLQMPGPSGGLPSSGRSANGAGGGIGIFAR